VHGVSLLSEPDLGRRADELAQAGSDGSEAAAALQDSFDRAVAKLDLRLQQLAGSPRFREAVTWQNPVAIDGALDPLLRWTPERGRDRKHRGREEVISSYWQRYCVKNDTIGFYGPLAWGTVLADVPDTTLECGEQVVGFGVVQFEAWAIDTLARVLSASPDARPWLPVRRVPFVGLADGLVRRPGEPPLHLDEPDLAVLRECTMGRRACDVVAAVRGAPGIESDEDAYAALARLVERRVVVWKLEVPVDPRPEQALRKLLERIGDPDVRDRLLEPLDSLERARDEVAAAAGSPDRLRRALAELDELFGEITGASPTRRAGQTYAGRTLVYHDTRRDVEVRLGGRFVEALEPLSLLLDSVRWLTWQFGQIVRASLLDTYDELRSRSDGPVDLATFWLAAMLVIDGSQVELDRVVGELQQRWEAILAVPADRPRVRYSVAELRAQVEAAFDAPCSGWAGARYCSPDLLVAAADVDAINAGDFEIVLGEMHLAINALRHLCFQSLHPKPERLLAAAEADFERPRLHPVLPKASPPRLTPRLHPALYGARDCHVSLLHHTVDPEQRRVVAAADVVVVRDGDALVARLATGEEFDALDVFSEALMTMVLDRHRILGEHLRHTPRVNFDSLVVARETWRFDPSDLAFAFESDEVARYVAARRWWLEAALPPQVFVRTGLEDKPFYVSVDSPFSVSVLGKAIRRLEREAVDSPSPIAFSEMLPRPDQCWLADAEGNKYSSEVRLVAFDLRE
jgi:hypothetical protein